MSKINEYINAVVEKISHALSSDIEVCKPLAGLLETTNISAIHGRTPGIFVTIVGSGESQLLETEQVDVTMLVVAYILVVKPDSINREVITNNIVTSLLGYVAGERWGLNYAHPATSVESSDLHGLAKGFKPDVSSWRYGVSVLARAADLYGGTDPISNMALWAVTWEQKLRLGTSAFDVPEFEIKQVFVREDGDKAKLIFNYDT